MTALLVGAIAYILLAEIRDWLEPARVQHDLRRVAVSMRCGHPEEAEAICRQYRFRPALYRRLRQEIELALEPAAEEKE